MLPAAAHVRSVYLSEDGVLAGIRPGTPTVDCSTIDPQTARDVSKAAAAKGVDMGMRRFPVVLAVRRPAP